ncbi:MAG: restriction endonuclease subunit S [Ignavibacterium sp.]|nr:restriction endonuclease subunit S [Ignavibacterium sp.]
MSTVNKLPPNWSWVKLGDVCETTSGGTPSRKNPKYYDGKIPWIKSGELNYNTIQDSEEKVTKEALENSNAKIFPKGTLLIALYGATVGRLAILGINATTNQAIAAIFTPSNLLNKFLYWFLFSYREKLLKQRIGGAQPNISQATLRNIPIPLPPIPEQKKIVEKIEELFSGLDSGVASLKKAKELVRLYRQSVLTAAFSGKLTTNKTPTVNGGINNEQLIIKNEKEKNNSSLPTGWKWVKTSDIIEHIDNGYTPKANLMSSGNGEIPFIKVYNLTFDGRLDFTKTPTFISNETHKKNLKRSITIPNDVLINIVGPPLGKVSIVPDSHKEWNINQAIVRFRPNKNITSKFLSYYLQNPNTMKWLESTSRATAGQYNIRVSTCREIPIPQISVNEQHQIVSEIEKRFSEADNLEKAIDDSLEKSEALRQSILSRAFSGKLV